MGRKKQTKKFTDAELIAALNINEGNVSATARDLDVSRQAIMKRRDSLPPAAIIPKEEFEAKKAEVIRDLQQKLLASVTESDIKNSSATQRMKMFGILEDKLRIIEGKATEHIAHVVEGNISEDFKNQIQDLIRLETERKRKAVQYDD